jgi:hypothetical protein
MAGLDPAITTFFFAKTWMPGTSPGMTGRKSKRPGAIPAFFYFVIASEAKQSRGGKERTGSLRRLHSSQ